MARFLIIIGSLIVTAAASGARADDQEIGAKTTIGEKTRLYHQCYENARDRDIDNGALEPCNRSLEEEDLTRRRMAIAHANRGVVHFNLGGYESAVADFTASLRLGIHVRAKIYVNRGVSHEALRNDALARADYQAAPAIAPDKAVAKRRPEELKKTLYDRSNVPHRITAELVSPVEGN